MTLAEVCSESFKELTWNISKQVEEWMVTVITAYGFEGEVTTENLKAQGFKGMCEKHHPGLTYNEIIYKVYKNNELLDTYTIKINFGG